MAVFRTPFYAFVSHQFQSDVIKRQIHEHLGATINQITNKSLNSFRIPFPREEQEQTAIAAILSDMDAEIATLEQKLAKTRQVKQGMMHEPLNRKNSTRMSIGQSERATQNRVIALFRDELAYRYLGDWTDRDGNSNIEEGLLTDYLTRRGYSSDANQPAPSTSCGPKPTTPTAASTTITRRFTACSATACR